MSRDLSVEEDEELGASEEGEGRQVQATVSRARDKTVSLLERSRGGSLKVHQENGIHKTGITHLELKCKHSGDVA